MKTSRFILFLVFLVFLAALAPLISGTISEFFEAAQEHFVSEKLSLPMWIDYSAVLVFGITGTITARTKGFDFIGAFVLAGITAMGGALVRDGICLQTEISPLFSDGNYMISVVGAWFLGMVFGEFFMKFEHFIVLCDAAGLGLYAVFGTNKALDFGLSAPVAVGIGMLNAVGGGLLRDVLARDEPMVFKPGQFYTAIAVIGSVLYIFLRDVFPPTLAAAIIVVFTIIFRFVAIRFNVHTQSVVETQEKLKKIFREIRDLKKHRHHLPNDFFDDIDAYDKKGESVPAVEKNGVPAEKNLAKNPQKNFQRSLRKKRRNRPENRFGNAVDQNSKN